MVTELCDPLSGLGQILAIRIRSPGIRGGYRLKAQGRRLYRKKLGRPCLLARKR